MGLKICRIAAMLGMVHIRVAQLAASLHPGCEKMKRKWRDNEEMERL